MNWVVFVRSEAEQDVSAAMGWYEQKRVVLGHEFLAEFASAIRQLEQYPEREHLYYRNFRRVILRRFPYKIFYQVLGQRVVVFRVLHAKQDHERQMDVDR